MYQTFITHSGLRIILAPSPTDVVYAGIAVATGTRHQLDSESGMAHLVEHMTFKGTTHRTSTQIINHIESLGGDLNAYTGKEETIYYATFLRQHLRRAIPLLFDIVFNSTFPQEELDKEVEVVIDEIESYNDSPADLIYEDFEALLFPHHPLGRKILGDAHRLRQYCTADLQQFTRRTYSPQRAVLFIKGNISQKELMRSLASSPTGGLQGARPAPCEASHSKNPSARPNGTLDPSRTFDSQLSTLNSQLSSPTEGLQGTSIIHKPLHQAHVMLGARAYAARDSRYYGLLLLSNLLGGPAMNSRLSLSLREKAGLVYTVESSISTYTDTGVWSVYFGCDPTDVNPCLRRIHRELHRLIDTPISPRTLAAAKRQLIGQIRIGYDNFESVALAIAKRFLHDDYAPTPDDIIHSIEVLTPAELQSIAAQIFDPQRLTTLIYQPAHA